MPLALVRSPRRAPHPPHTPACARCQDDDEEGGGGEEAEEKPAAAARKGGKSKPAPKDAKEQPQECKQQ